MHQPLYGCNTYCLTCINQGVVWYLLLLVCRRNLGYEEVLADLAKKGIAIRVASPKLVMEEVCLCGVGVSA